MESKLVTYDKLKEIFDAKGYAFFTGEFNLNVGGIRSNDKTPDAFNDILFVAYTSEIGMNTVYIMQGTTDPGTYWLQNPMNTGGCFVLKAGQYRGSHKLGLHQGKIPAMVQCGILTGWRDKNRDNVVDIGGDTFEGSNFGVNIHPMGDKLTKIYNWSAGCQGASTDDIDYLLYLVHRQLDILGSDKISYTLLNEDDFYS